MKKVLKLKNYEDVCSTCQCAIKLDPNNSKALYRRGLANIELKNYELALDDLKRAHQILPENKRLVWILLSVLSVQVLLGIFTLINCTGVVPVGLGVLHQAGAVVLIGVILWVCYKTAKRSKDL